ncbi:MAG: hypothetical protein AAGA54_22335 [Myxococcota bacterium]
MIQRLVPSRAIGKPHPALAEGVRLAVGTQAADLQPRPLRHLLVRTLDEIDQLADLGTAKGLMGPSVLNELQPTIAECPDERPAECICVDWETRKPRSQRVEAELRLRGLNDSDGMLGAEVAFDATPLENVYAPMLVIEPRPTHRKNLHPSDDGASAT